jgi:hypothetical protein
MNHSLAVRLLWLAFCVTAVGLAACALVPSIGGKPTIVIVSPASGSTHNEGVGLEVQSTSIDSIGIARVDLLVDGSTVRSDTPPGPQSSFTVIQTWKAVAGAHIISVRAYNTAGVPSDPVGISITVTPAGGAPTAAPGATAVPTTGSAPTVVAPTTAPAVPTTAPPPPPPPPPPGATATTPVSGTCRPGFVWRLINPSDKVCVTPASQAQAAADNAAAASRREVAAFGPDTCQTGFVWREAYSGDHVCVDPSQRTQAANDNTAAASRKLLLYGPDTCNSG